MWTTWFNVSRTPESFLYGLLLSWHYSNFNPWILLYSSLSDYICSFFFSFLPQRCPILPEHGWSNKLIQAHESGNLEELSTFHDSFNSFCENLGIIKPFDADNNQGNIVHNFLLLSLTSLGFKNFPMTSFSHTKSFCTSLLSLATGRGSLRNGRLPTLISWLFPLLNAIYDNQSDEIILSSNPSGHPSQSITFRQPNARFSHYTWFNLHWLTGFLPILQGNVLSF